MEVSEIPAWCEAFIGLPYEPGGKTRDGLDCWGLFNLVWSEQFGRPLPDYDGIMWRKGASPAEVSAGASTYCSRFAIIPDGEERVGDAIMFRMRGHPFHVAMVIAPGWMLHVEEKTDSCVARYRSIHWETRIVNFYRYE
ncbi:Endopeptidase, NLPC/P60 domain containing protein [uncultured Caudovirales phage]|uniref:Endopeptidase, NLPC/P60 domain containing protein n=1 Tax=uncultured Caudovirales phage TaxID=2100421 RepID=A0A6J5KM68_9CAUD|nr:Endopeptidase, NLPC/P60 domain containing protein [uncultured Caudovirales phage]CAB4123766.1 Endopeptidase, NLPC/P60 domain containing protein [uncultured Caudovirales phage]